MSDQTKLADNANKGITILRFNIGVMHSDFKENRLSSIVMIIKFSTIYKVIRKMRVEVILK